MPVLKVICRQEERYFAQTGFPKYHDDEALETVISYCRDPAKTADDLTGGLGVKVDQAAYEMDRLAWAYGKNCGLRLRHWVLSFSHKELKRFRSSALDILKKFAWYAAAYYGYQYQIIYAIHTDTDCPHIHFVMNTVSYTTGQKYGGKIGGLCGLPAVSI